MSGTEIPPAAALYSEVDDIVKQQGERRHGLIHRLQTGRALPSLLIFPQRTPGKYMEVRRKLMKITLIIIQIIIRQP